MASPLDIGEAVSNANDGLARIGQRPKQVHHLAVGLLVQAARDFIEEQQARLAQNLIGEAGCA